MLASFIFQGTREGTSVYMSSFRACLLILVLMSPWTVFAAGLGKLTINSALGQPLDAEIDLVAVKNEEISSLAAQLGSLEAFNQAGIDYKSFFSTFDISIDSRANGDPFIKITSPNTINEPFLNMLIELNWASGRLMREYTVLLDPVDTVTPEPVAPVINDYTVEVEIQSPEKGSTLYPIEEANDPAKPAQVLNGQGGESAYRPVLQGDTLSDIARQYAPDGVSLNQILIAMFRANRDAFIEDNINLLKAGVVLQIPSRNEIAAISESEANKEVKIHVADWRSYRNRLVAASSEAPANEEILQSDAGQITTTMSDQGMASDEPPTEVLRLSSGGQIDDVSNDNSVTAPQKLRMMEEDAIARNLALKEANERIAMLEKSIQDLQRLLEIKDPTLAEAQQQAENLLSPESVVPEPGMLVEEPEIMQDSGLELESESIAVISDQVDLLSDAAMEDATISPEDSMVQTGDTEAFVPAGEIVSGKAPSLANQLMNSIEYVGGAAAFLLLGTLAAIRMRRKKSEDDFDAEEAEHASSILRERLASVAAVDSQASYETEAAHMDPNGSMEADAADPFDEALKKEEVDVATEENLDEMDADFKDKSQQEGGFLASQSDESDEEVNIDLADAADDSQRDESNEPFDDAEFDLDLGEPATDADRDMSDQKEAELGLNIDDEPSLERSEVPEPTVSESDDILNLDVTEPDASKVSEESTPQAEVEALPFEESNDITFDLDRPAEKDSAEPDTSDEPQSDDKIEVVDPTIDFPDVSDSSVQTDAGKMDEMGDDSETSVKQEEGIGLDLNLSAESDASADSNLLSSNSTLSDLKTEMDISVPDAEETVEQPIEVATEKDAHWHEVETKIDLAKAYLDMEDYEGAKEILGEVINEGDSKQQENAKAMLAQL